MQINKFLILLFVLLSSLLGCNHRKVTQNDGDMPVEDIFNLRGKRIFYASSDRLNSLHLLVAGTTSKAGRFVVPAVPVLQIPVCS